MAENESTGTDSGAAAAADPVTVVSADQFQSMVDAVVTAINGIKDAIEAQTTLIKEKFESLETTIDTDLKDDTSRIEAIIAAHTEALEAHTETLSELLSTIDSRLHTNLDKYNLHINYKDTHRGDRDIAFIEASRLETILIGDEDELDGGSDDEGSEGSSGSDDDSGSDEEDEETVDASETIKTTQESILKDFATYSFDVTTGERLTFKTKEDFDSSKTGLSFDFTRSYIEKMKEQEGVTANEYALLVYESNTKTAEMEGESSIERMKTWNDLKEIQTVVITENNETKTAFVYMPTDSTFQEPNTEEFKTTKEAMDWIVKEYQNAIDEQHMGIAFVPVSSIERGCLLEDYRTKAKTQTAACEYT